MNTSDEVYEELKKMNKDVNMKELVYDVKLKNKMIYFCWSTTWKPCLPYLRKGTPCRRTLLKAMKILHTKYNVYFLTFELGKVKRRKPVFKWSTSDALPNETLREYFQRKYKERKTMI